MPAFEPILPAFPDDTPVWRYSNLWALLWAIEQKKLYLSLLDELRRKYDPFEASVPRATKDGDMVMTSGNTGYTDGTFFGGDVPSSLTELLREDPQTRLGRLRKGLLRSAYASCWRHGDESAAMWQLYCGRGDGVAIQTTFGALRDSIKDPDSFVSLVAYISYSADTFVLHRQNYHPALHKHRAFSIEQEVRVLRYREDYFSKAATPKAATDPDFRPDAGCSIEWDLESVVKRIVVTPYAPAAYMSTVESNIRRLSDPLANLVVASELGAEPVY